MNWHQACELPYYHGSDLGANPTAEDTTFKLWAPTACGVVVCLFATGDVYKRQSKTKWNICWMCCCSGRQRKKRL